MYNCISEVFKVKKSMEEEARRLLSKTGEGISHDDLKHAVTKNIQAMTTNNSNLFNIISNGSKAIKHGFVIADLLQGPTDCTELTPEERAIVIEHKKAQKEEQLKNTRSRHFYQQQYQPYQAQNGINQEYYQQS